MNIVITYVQRDTYVGPSMALTTSFYVIWQVISVYVKKMCGNGNQTFKKQDLQNY